MEPGEKRKECSHYGVDYFLTVTYSAEGLAVTAEERLTGMLWRGSFQAEFIEEVTRKTGNYKRFPVYVKMLLAAMEGSSKSVLLELVSHQQMEALRAKKRSQPSSTRADSHLYMILTYAVEFDKVHYPLPLAQEELSPAEQSQVIRQLRLQIDSLKRLVPPQNLTAIDLVHENARLREELSRVRESDSVETRVSSLQQELEVTKAKSQKQVTYLQKINGELREELSKAKETIDVCVTEMKNRGEPDEVQELRSELDETKEELNTTKEELKRFRDLYEESEQMQSKLRATLKTFQTDLQGSHRYETSPEVESSDVPSVRSSHRRLFQESDPGSPNSDDINSRMMKIRELLQRQDII